MKENTDNGASVPTPGQVIDLRGSRGKDKPLKSKTSSRPMQPIEDIVVPEVGGVIDFRAKREEAREQKSSQDRPRNERAPKEARSNRNGGGEERKREKPPAKDITVVVMGLSGKIDSAAATIDAIHAQKLPWEVEVIVMAPKGRFDFNNARIFKPRNVNNPADVMDYAIQRSNSDIVVFVDGDVIPQGDRWLVGLTDPLFEESSVGVVDCPVLKSGETVDSMESKTFHKHDKEESRTALSGRAFAVRKSVAMKSKFDAGEGTRADWTDRVLSGGFTRRFEASVAVEETSGAPVEKAPEAAPEKEERTQPAQKAKPAQKARPARKESRRKKVVPPTPAMHPEEAPPLWQLPMQIGQRTAEKYLQIAMDKKQRTLSSVLLAPVNATREVLGTYKKGGLPIPSIFTKDE